MGGSRGVAVEVLGTKIVRRIVAVGLAACCGLATAQQPFGQRLGDVVSAPATTQTNPPGAVQTPTITNAPGGQQRPGSASPQQSPGLTDQRPQVFQLPARQERNEFQDFIELSTGRKLPIFGQELFEGGPSTFAPVENIAVPANYLIGPGDELQIRAWGQIDVDYRATVDRNGMVNIPRVGSISVAGVKYQDLSEHVKSALSRNYRNFEVLVTLGQLRAVQVFVVGYARRPGNYTVSSLSTLVNAIFAAGGPSLSGSMRSVQLKRGSQVVTELDLYDLLLAGDKSKDAPLMPGDVIYFPAIGPLAAVTGSVNHPAIFELRRETTLGTLLGYAGGLSTTARSRQITIERIDDRKARTVEQVDFGEEIAKRPMKDGDLVSVLAILPRFDNAVSLRGNVATPLRYPYREGMRIADLIPDREVLITPDYYRRQNLAVKPEPIGPGIVRPDGSVQRPISQRPDFQGAELARQDSQRSEIQRQDPQRPDSPADAQQRLENVSAPRQEQVSQQKLMDNVRRLSAEINWDYAVVERLNRNDLTTQLIPFNLGKAVLERDDQHNLVLMPGDVVTVFSKTDVAAPADRRPVVVSLEGEFNFAGVYQAKPKETMRQMIARVGGITPRAYLFGTEFTRESTRKEQEERLKTAIDQLEQDLQRASGTRARSVTSPEDAASLTQEANAQRSLIARMRALKPTGRIVLQLPERPKLDDFPDFELEDGDRVMIPQQPSQVSVFGTVFNESSFVYLPDHSVGDYLEQAGGPRKQADKSSIYLLRANGSVVSARQAGFFSRAIDRQKPMPGDAIIVPEDFERTTWMKDLRDWTQIFYQFGLGAAALKVIQQ
jgi:polysaccharide export outer membrane protein